MLTALRQELNTLLLASGPSRKPALRHAGREGWLLCSDVPQLLDANALQALCAALTQHGWQSMLLNGWLYFDKPVPVPAVEPATVLSGHAACAASLLRRHVEGGVLPEVIRQLCCAHDKGPVHVERVCCRLHGQLAEMLRLHQPLPGGLLPYVLRAAAYDKEETR